MATVRNMLDPLLNAFKYMPPALTGGLIVFMTILFFISVAVPTLNESLSLQSSMLTSLELNRLTWYPMIHMNLLHLGLNAWALLPLLSSFELSNGTVRTGIVLNVLATITGLAYVIISLIFFPTSAVLGSSSWVFSFMGYFTYMEQLKTPTTYLSSNFMIPTWTKPFIILVVTAVILPGSSFLGHLLGLCAGFLMAMGHLKFMIEPPSKVVLWIESKLAFLIALIPPQIRYIKEIDAIEIRKNSAIAPGATGASASGLPLHEIVSPIPVSAVPSSPFSGPGKVLGSIPGSSEATK